MQLRNLLCGDFVVKIVGVEAIEAAGGSFRLRVHEKADRPAGGAGKHDVVREVEGYPIHFPGAEEAYASFAHHFVVEPTIARRLLEDDFANVGGIDGDPAEILQMNFGTAVLCFRDDFGRGTEALVSEFGFRYANAVNVARGQTARPAEADEERVEVGTFTAEVLCFEHETNVTETAA